MGCFGGFEISGLFVVCVVLVGLGLRWFVLGSFGCALCFRGWLFATYVFGFGYLLYWIV